MQNYFKPIPLKRGDKIAIIAPSSPITSTVEIKRAIPILEKFNLKPVLGPNILYLRSDNWSSASIKDRVDEITWAFTSPEINAIIVAEGGYSSMELLPYLPYDEIKNSKRLFLGMSDVTSINNALLAKSNLANFSGPNLRIRSDVNGDELNLEYTLQMLFANKKWGSDCWRRAKTFPRCICDGIAKGTAIGGNLTLFTSLLGTPYFPNIDGSILFFEDVYSGGWEASICLNQLDLAGVFDRANGVVIGDFEHKQKRSDQDLALEDVFVRFFKNKIPCIYGMPFSHGSIAGTIPIGTNTLIDAEKCQVLFDNPFENNIL